jgi:hypothetical protein
MLSVIEKQQVPLTALWVYDFPWQGQGHDPYCNVTASNARAYQLQAIAEANARIRAALAK